MKKLKLFISCYKKGQRLLKIAQNIFPCSIPLQHNVWVRNTFFPHDIHLMFLLLMQIRPCLTGCATVAAVTLTAKRWALPHWIKTISMTSREKRKKKWRESKSAGQKRRILFFPSCFFLETREYFFFFAATSLGLSIFSFFLIRRVLSTTISLSLREET